MAGYKKDKQIKQREAPKGKHIMRAVDPEQYYSQKPAWSFAYADQEKWAFSKSRLENVFWSDVFPKMRNLETKTWGEILITAKKQNHSIEVDDLNKVAQDRLFEKRIEAESLISLRLTGTHRLYGYMTGRVFNILWYDDDHGDNAECVCRSRLKHT